MKFLYLALISIILTTNCARQIVRLDEKENIDLQGKWNDTDARMTAEAMTQQILKEPWLQNFTMQRNGKKPVVIVGLIRNKTHEHISSEMFIKQIEREMIRQQKVRLVEGGEKREQIRMERASQMENASKSTMKKWGLEIGADYLLQGDINANVETHKRTRITTYQINLQLTDIETSEVIWIGEKRIKKKVTN